MSDHQRQPHYNRGRGRDRSRDRGRGTYYGVSNRGGILGQAPPNYPLPNVQPEATGGNQTKREETITTYVEGGKVVTTKTVITTEVPSRPTQQLQELNTNFNCNPQIPPPQYATLNQTPYQPGGIGCRGVGPGQLPPQRTYHANAYEGHHSLQVNQSTEQHTHPRVDSARGRPPVSRSDHREYNPGQSMGQRTRGSSRNQRTRSKDRKAMKKVPSLLDISIDDTNDPETYERDDVEENTNDESRRDVHGKQKGKRRGNPSQNDNSKEQFENVLSGLENITRNTNYPNKAAIPSKGHTRGKCKKEKDDSGNKMHSAMGKRSEKSSESEEHESLSFRPNLDDVFNFMVRNMKGKGSPSDIKKRSGLFPDSFDDKMTEQWFKQHRGKFKSIIRNEHVDVVLVYEHQMNYCLDYISKRLCKKDKCTRYHLCKDMLCGNCIYGAECIKSHDFFDPNLDNLSISKEFRNNNKNKYNNKQMLSLMQCRYPHVCHNWNQEQGCSEDHCEKLHICKSYVLGKCEKGDDCDLVHDRMSEHNKPIVCAYGMESWKDESFRRIIFIQREPGHKVHGVSSVDETKSKCSNVKAKISNEKAKTSNEKARSSKEKAEKDILVDLCESYLVDECKSTNCSELHNDELRLPYVWQVKLWNQWYTTSLSEEVEKEFCALKDKSEPFYVKSHDSRESELVEIEFHPNISARIPDKKKVVEARRLSTKSFICTGKRIFRTQWRWYYEDNTGEPQPYSPDVLQQNLEMKYLAGQSNYTFIKDGFPYIDFKSMCLCSGGNYSRILRRPLLVTRDDVDNKQIPPFPGSFVNIKVPLQQGWSPWDIANRAELVKLSQSSDEYLKVDEKFFEHLDRGRLQIRNIFRIQNSEQWEQFASKTDSMKIALRRSDTPQTHLDRRYLFHGTDNFEAVKGICGSNLDPRVSGKNATNFGQGTYFAVESRLAHTYTKAPDRYVFMVNVLVGEFTKGKSTYRKPPEKPDSDGEFYDSCVDDLQFPMKFVLFDSNQYYPEYLIWYQDDDEDDF